MSEDAALMAQIAEMAGRINRHRQGVTPEPRMPQHTYTAHRWSPYGHSRGGSRRGGHKGFRNLQLLNKPVGGVTRDPNRECDSGNTTSTPTPEPEKLSAGVTTHNRNNMQWTNSAVFDQKVQAKVRAMEQTQLEKREVKDRRMQNKVLEHVYGTAQVPTDQQVREIVIKDVRFRVATDGSKLIRIFDTVDPDPRTTPKVAQVAGVTFIRTKNGNMIRKTNSSIQDHVPGNSRKLCPDFTSTGSCVRGNRCRFKHDVGKLAVCKDFLRHGKCSAGEACDLSHELTPHRVPTCLHFLRNNCTKPDCPYTHASSASMPVCHEFARLGYCEKGAFCPDRHVSECPDYSNTGACELKNCRLPHIDTAHNLRKQAAAHGRDTDMVMDVSSEEEDYDEIDSDDVDSGDDGGSWSARPTGTGHELSQQQDFISFK